MAKRGSTRPWRMKFEWDNGVKGVVTFHTEEEAEHAAKQQRERVGQNGARCTTVTVEKRGAK